MINLKISFYKNKYGVLFLDMGFYNNNKNYYYYIYKFFVLSKYNLSESLNYKNTNDFFLRLFTLHITL